MNSPKSAILNNPRIMAAVEALGFTADDVDAMSIRELQALLVALQEAAE